MNRILTGILALCLLLACACNTVVHGKVTNKTVHPPLTTFLVIMSPCGKGCIMPIMVPITYPESYSITVDGPDKEGKPAQDELYLDVQAWGKTSVGDTYECGAKKECITSRPGGQQQ